ncbi:unnamed protein product [Zymoseptoria tritici ST99CH_3D7]|uniref:Uncharacterized protein n=1 Tax=Zymoseptoria tritici (strain ST99CH_3D7) TaxID=1276538 RepID=A0A1X7RM56_ZYMT9|nr:unnamed protein product [Zymoseptoria tritici ST99CH_3D7]
MGITRKRSEEELLAMTKKPRTLRKERSPPYDSTQEQPFHAITKAKEWEAVNFWARHMHSLLSRPFRHNGDDDDIEQDLISGIDGILLEPSPILVGVSGNCGCGKSKVLNSLFSIGEIAPSNADGGQVTVTSNEFCGRKEGQAAKYLAEVVFLSPAERHDVLAGFVRDYYGGIFQRAGAARALLSLFKGLPECRSIDAVRRILTSAEPRGGEAVTAQLVRWADGLIAQALGNDEIVTLTASNEVELLSQLATYTSEGSVHSGPSLMHCVSIVRIHFSNPLLDLGISFLDTPELNNLEVINNISDLPKSRHITHAMVAAKTGCLVPTVSIGTSKMQRLGSNRVVVVVTGADQVGDNYTPRGTKDRKDTATRLKAKCVEMDAIENSLREQIDECDDCHQLPELFQQLDETRASIKQSHDAEKVHRIKMNNERIEARLRETLTYEGPVLPLSNTKYETHFAGYLPRDAPALSVEETNIPELRRLVATFPNEIRLGEVRQLVEVVMPAQLDRLDAFVSQEGTHDRLRSGLVKVLPQARAMLDGPVRSAFDALCRDFQ